MSQSIVLRQRMNFAARLAKETLSFDTNQDGAFSENEYKDYKKNMDGSPRKRLQGFLTELFLGDMKTNRVGLVLPDMALLDSASIADISDRIEQLDRVSQRDFIPIYNLIRAVISNYKGSTQSYSTLENNVDYLFSEIAQSSFDSSYEARVNVAPEDFDKMITWFEEAFTKKYGAA